MKKWQWILLTAGLLASSYAMAALTDKAQEGSAVSAWCGTMAFVCAIASIIGIVGACGGFKDQK